MTQMHPTTGQVTEYQGSFIDAYDADRVEEQARALARAYREKPGEPIALDFQPGNGTRYFMVFTPLDEGARRMAGNDWIMSLPDHRVCYTLSLPCHMTPSYVQEKFLPSISDAVVLSHLLLSASKAIRAAG